MLGHLRLGQPEHTQFCALRESLEHRAISTTKEIGRNDAAGNASGSEDVEGARCDAVLRSPGLGPGPPVHLGRPDRRRLFTDLAARLGDRLHGRQLRPERPLAQRARPCARGHPGVAPRGRRRVHSRRRRQPAGVRVRQQRRRHDRPRARRAATPAWFARSWRTKRPSWSSCPMRRRRCSEFHAIHECSYRAKGVFPALGRFGALVEEGGPRYSEEMEQRLPTEDEQEMMGRMAANFDLFIAHEMRAIGGYEPVDRRLFGALQRGPSAQRRELARAGSASRSLRARRAPWHCRDVPTRQPRRLGVGSAGVRRAAARRSPGSSLSRDWTASGQAEASCERGCTRPDS